VFKALYFQLTNKQPVWKKGTKILCSSDYCTYNHHFHSKNHLFPTGGFRSCIQQGDEPPTQFIPDFEMELALSLLVSSSRAALTTDSMISAIDVLLGFVAEAGFDTADFFCSGDTCTPANITKYN
jgi:hypothetical protein